MIVTTLLLIWMLSESGGLANNFCLVLRNIFGSRDVSFQPAVKNVPLISAQFDAPTFKEYIRSMNRYVQELPTELERSIMEATLQKKGVTEQQLMSDPRVAEDLIGNLLNKVKGEADLMIEDGEPIQNEGLAEATLKVLVLLKRVKTKAEPPVKELIKMRSETGTFKPAFVRLGLTLDDV